MGQQPTNDPAAWPTKGGRASPTAQLVERLKEITALRENGFDDSDQVYEAVDDLLALVNTQAAEIMLLEEKLFKIIDELRAGYECRVEDISRLIQEKETQAAEIARKDAVIADNIMGMSRRDVEIEAQAAELKSTKEDLAQRETNNAKLDKFVDRFDKLTDEQQDHCQELADENEKLEAEIAELKERIQLMGKALNGGWVEAFREARELRSTTKGGDHD